MKIIILIAIIMIASGCAMKTVSGLTCKSDFERGQTCTIYDPVFKKQVPIDPMGVTVVCNSNKLCNYIYVDSMRTVWEGKQFKE